MKFRNNDEVNEFNDRKLLTKMVSAPKLSKVDDDDDNFKVIVIDVVITFIDYNLNCHTLNPPTFSTQFP